MVYTIRVERGQNLLTHDFSEQKATDRVRCILVLDGGARVGVGIGVHHSILERAIALYI